MAKGAKGPTPEQQALLNAILNGPAARPPAAGGGEWSSRAQARNARVGQQQHIKSLTDKLGSGGFNPLEKAMEALSFLKSTVVSGGEQVQHGIVKGLEAVDLLEPVPMPKPAIEQAKNYAYSVVIDSMESKLGKRLTPKQVDYFRVIDPNVNQQFAEAAIGFYKDKGLDIKAERQQVKYLNAGPSWDAFTRGIKNNEGVLDMASKNMGHIGPTGEATGVFEGNDFLSKAGNFGVGFVGDALVDPVVAFSPKGAGDVANLVSKAEEGATAAKLVGDAERAAALEDIATKLLRTKTAASLTSEEAAQLGERLGYTMFGKDLGGQAFRHGVFETVPLNKVRTAVGDLLDKTLRSKNALNGAKAAIKADMRSGVRERAMNALRSGSAVAREQSTVGHIAEEFTSAANDALKASGLKDHEMAHAFDALQGNVESAAILGDGEAIRGIGRIAPIKAWFESVRSRVRELTGRDVGYIEDYVPHQVTSEMRARLLAGNKRKASLYSVVHDLAFAKERTIRAGSKLFGEIIPEGMDTPDKVVRWANEMSKEVFGHDMFKTDLVEIMNGYAHAAARYIGQSERDFYLAQRGLFEVNPNLVSKLEDKVIPRLEKGVGRAESAVGRAERARSKIEGALKGAQASTRAAEESLAWTAQSRETAQNIVDHLMVGAQPGAAMYKNVARDQLAGLDYQHQFINTFVPSGAADPYHVSSLINAEAARALKFADGEAANALRDAQRFAEAAQTATDPLEAVLASQRAQEAMTMAQLHEADATIGAAKEKVAAKTAKLASANQKLSVAKLEYLTDMTAQNARMFLNTHVMEPGVQEHLANIAEQLAPKNAKGFWKHYDQAQTWLKSWQIASPRFLGHILVGHTWNNFLAKIEVSAYQMYADAALAMKRSPEAWAKYAAEEPEVAEAFMQLSKRVMGSHGDFSRIELGVTSNRPTWKPTRNNIIPWAARKGGSEIQKFARVSLGLDEIINKGGTLDSALERIATYHFDYGDLSQFEKTVVKRVIPFYTWTRRNVPLQIEMLLKNPKVAETYNLFKDNMNQASGGLEGLVPSYFSSLGAYRTPLTLQGSAVYGTDELVPLKELGAISAAPFDVGTYASMASPLIKDPLELLMGKQFYKDMPLDGSYRVPIPLPSPLSDVLAPLLAKAGLAKVDKQGNATVDQRLAYVLESFGPAIANMNRVSGVSERDQQRQLVNVVNLLTGASLKANTPADKQAEIRRRSYAQK